MLFLDIQGSREKGDNKERKKEKKRLIYPSIYLSIVVFIHPFDLFAEQ